MKLKIPLFYKTHSSSGNGKFPELFDFVFDFDANNSLPYQKSSKELKNMLSEIYLSGSMMTGSMNEYDLVGMQHANYAVELILNSYKDLNQKKVLEIGCGNGYIIKKMLERGAICTGLEPGVQAESLSFDDLRVVNDFFPTKEIKDEKFDLILHFNVLEHIESPASMMSEISEILEPDGIVIFGVPNCESFLKNGDPSIFLHEHFNYFTIESLQHILNEAGLHLINAELGSSDAMLFITASKNDVPKPFSIDYRFSPESFLKKNEVLKENLVTILEQFPHGKIAAYSPNRALNLLSVLGVNDVRIIDDTPFMHNQYYPFFNKPVENFEDAVNNPPELIIIFSVTHGEKILRKCHENINLRRTRIILLSDLYCKDKS